MFSLPVDLIHYAFDDHLDGRACTLFASTNKKMQYFMNSVEPFRTIIYFRHVYVEAAHFHDFVEPVKEANLRTKYGLRKLALQVVSEDLYNLRPDGERIYQQVSDGSIIWVCDAYKMGESEVTLFQTGLHLERWLGRSLCRVRHLQFRSTSHVCWNGVHTEHGPNGGDCCEFGKHRGHVVIIWIDASALKTKRGNKPNEIEEDQTSQFDIYVYNGWTCQKYPKSKHTF